MKTDYSLFSPETQVELARLREEIAADPHNSEPERLARLKQAIATMRGERTSAIQAAAASARKGPRAPKASKEDRIAAVDVNKAMEGF